MKKISTQLPIHGQNTNYQLNTTISQSYTIEISTQLKKSIA